MLSKLATSPLALFLLMIWDGFLIIGEGLGLSGRHARRFADVAWISLTVVTLAWLASMAVLAPGVMT